MKTKNQHATSFTNENAANDKIHEQNQFHVDKNQCISLTMRKNQYTKTFSNRKKNQNAKISGTKNQHARSFISKISYTRRENQFTSFADKNQEIASSTKKRDPRRK